MSQSKDSKDAMEAFDNAKAAESAVPGQHGEHGHSHAAHLETEGKAKTEPQGYGKQGREPGTRIEPPQNPNQGHKDYRHER